MRASANHTHPEFEKHPDSPLARLKTCAHVPPPECLVFGRISDPKHTHILRLWSVVISLQAGAYLVAYENVKYVCHMFPKSVAVWNLYSSVVNKAGNTPNQYKFVLRCLLKYPERSTPHNAKNQCAPSISAETPEALENPETQATSRTQTKHGHPTRPKLCPLHHLQSPKRARPHRLAKNENEDETNRQSPKL